jgi:V/A-type H+/Na+-transporting ATPase subunit E
MLDGSSACAGQGRLHRPAGVASPTIAAGRRDEVPMDEQLQSLLDRIQHEGVERAEAEASRILAEADERARRIIADAEAEAAEIRARAEADASASVERAEKALEQTARDFLLSLRNSIEALLRESLRGALGDELSPAVVAEMLVGLADAYAAHDMNESRVDVLLAPGDQDALAALVMEKYRDLMRQGLTLRPDERIDKGFKVSFVDYNLYHDFTAEALADALAPVLKPPLSDIVRRAAAELD